MMVARSSAAAAARVAGERALAAARLAKRFGDDAYARTAHAAARLALSAARRPIVDDKATATVARLASAAAAVTEIVAAVRACGASLLDPATEALLGRCSAASRLIDRFLDGGGTMTRDFVASVGELQRDAAAWRARQQFGGR